LDTPGSRTDAAVSVDSSYLARQTDKSNIVLPKKRTRSDVKIGAV
jgi:hypothetical protein